MWTLPNPDLFGRSGAPDNSLEENNAELLAETLSKLGYPCAISAVLPGATVTRYLLEPQESVRKITSLTADLQYMLAAKSITVQAPLPGARAVAVDVPRRQRVLVRTGDVLGAVERPLEVALGVDTYGQPALCRLPEMPHLLIAGTTGAGKSACINNMLCQLLARHNPDELSLVLIDPKMVELTPYDGIPHLLYPIVNDTHLAIDALNALVDEMESRYARAAKLQARTLDELNLRLTDMGEKPLPYIVVFVDELADLMLVARYDVEKAVVRIAQKARAVGIHLIMATQTPRVVIVTGLLKANLPSRIAFAVASQIDSRVILDTNGAETLLGAGDSLYAPITSPTMTRIQSAYINSNEISNIVAHWRNQKIGPTLLAQQMEIERLETPEEYCKRFESEIDSICSEISDLFLQEAKAR